MPGMKYFESLKVWKNICRALHPFGQPNPENREGAEDVEAVWLHKIEYGIKCINIHTSEVWCGSCCDCSHDWFKEAATITALAQVEGLKVFQRWHNLKCLKISGLWN